MTIQRLTGNCIVLYIALACAPFTFFAGFKQIRAAAMVALLDLVQTGSL